MEQRRVVGWAEIPADGEIRYCCQGRHSVWPAVTVVFHCVDARRRCLRSYERTVVLGAEDAESAGNCSTHVPGESRREGT